MLSHRGLGAEEQWRGHGSPNYIHNMCLPRCCPKERQLQNILLALLSAHAVLCLAGVPACSANAAGTTPGLQPMTSLTMAAGHAHSLGAHEE